MKTIQERAAYLADYVLENVDPADALLFRKLITESYMAGAEDEREELSRWHDPKEELPEDGKDVLCMTDRLSHTYEVLRHDKHGWWMRVYIQESGWCACDCNVIGWREIHKNQ